MNSGAVPRSSLNRPRVPQPQGPGATLPAHPRPQRGSRDSLAPPRPRRAPAAEGPSAPRRLAAPLATQGEGRPRDADTTFTGAVLALKPGRQQRHLPFLSRPARILAVLQRTRILLNHCQVGSADVGQTDNLRCFGVPGAEVAGRGSNGR